MCIYLRLPSNKTLIPSIIITLSDKMNPPIIIGLMVVLPSAVQNCINILVVSIICIITTNEIFQFGTVRAQVPGG